MENGDPARACLYPRRFETLRRPNQKRLDLFNPSPFLANLVSNI
jgi:hypothetical protein